MTAWLLAVAVIVVAAIVVATLTGLVKPVRNRLEPVRMRATGDHGIALIVSVGPEQMNSIRPENMLNLDPRWLSGTSFYFSSTEPPVERPPRAGADWWAWANRNGGEDVVFTHVLIRLQATQDRTVVIERPRVAQSVRPVTSGVICSPEGLGGNGLLCRRFYVDLDEAEPDVIYVDASEERRETAQFVMKKGDTEAFVIIAKTLSGRHEWSLEIPCVVDGQRLTLNARNEGRPFVTVGPEGVQRYMYADGQWLVPG